MLRKAKGYAVDRLLLDRFGGRGAAAWPPNRPDVENVQASVISF
jgi:hypothetical protein